MTLLGVGAVAAMLSTTECRVRSLSDRGLLPCEPRPTPLAKRHWRLDIVEQYLLCHHPVGQNEHGPTELRIWARVQQSGDGCWTFTGTLSGGYGQIGWKPNRRTHIVMYEAARGPVPAGLQLDHLCRNRACCNPDHLEAVTPRENLRRGQGWSGRNYRKTHCVAGHGFTPQNTYRDSRGRHCRACHARREAERRARQKATA